ncbi:DinB family protein [Arenibacterium halophilum]|uniref:Nuclease n=1 Tax=Arenibacterium halophilum TaxID=2583821 RepID=A0ABY2X8B5_9RHOB|nr:DinB family protein [Arenibacterium halophilum]TMV11430.1 nuclease [Arenibacterium halophilum]
MTPAAAPFRLLAQNNAWANATLHRAVGTLPAGGFAAPAPGFFGSLKATLNHIWQVDLYYLDALESGGLGRSVYDQPELDDPTELARAQADVDARFIRFCFNLTAEALTETRQTARPEGMVQERVDALILHLAQHQVHHRGQAHVQLQTLGVAPPQLDEFFLDYDRAPTAQAYFDS